MSTSDTPRTDAFMQGEHVAIDSLWYNFARELERELADARADADTYRNACDTLRDKLRDADDTITDLREQLEIERAPDGPCAEGSLS